MKTIRTISNISYNSLEYFEACIDSLVSRRKIDWAYWIWHEPDIDERKAHIHFVLKPSARLETADLRACFFERDPNPLQTRPLAPTTKWNPCNSLSDWLLYAVHDVPYLASKGQKRNITYSYDDLRATDYDALNADWTAIDRSRFDRLQSLLDAVRDGIPFAILVQQGRVPIAQRAQFEHQYNALLRLQLVSTAGRVENHDLEAVDEEDMPF